MAKAGDDFVWGPAEQAASRERLARAAAKSSGMGGNGATLLVVIGIVAVIVAGIATMIVSSAIRHDQAVAEAAKPKPPQPVSSVDTSIQSVSIVGDTMTVRDGINDAPDYEGYVILAGTTAEAIGKAVKQGGYAENLAAVKTVVMVERASAKDRLGHVTMQPFMSFTLSGDNLRAAEYENLQWAGVLDLADRVQVNSREGRLALAIFCAKHDGDAPHFCSKALA